MVYIMKFFLRNIKIFLSPEKYLIECIIGTFFDNIIVEDKNKLKR